MHASELWIPLNYIKKWCDAALIFSLFTGRSKVRLSFKTTPWSHHNRGLSLKTWFRVMLGNSLIRGCWVKKKQLWIYLFLSYWLQFLKDIWFILNSTCFPVITLNSFEAKTFFPHGKNSACQVTCFIFILFQQKWALIFLSSNFRNWY